MSIDRDAALAKVNTALANSDIARATESAREALEKGVEHPLLLNLRAYWLESQNRPHEALADLTRANAIAPDDAIVLNALGLCLARLNRLAEAYKALTGAALADPGFSAAHFNRGWVAEELGLLDIAKSAFLRASQCDPESAAPLARLAFLAARTGQSREAKDHADRTLFISPENVTALLAYATADFQEGAFASAESRLASLLADERTGPLDRAIAYGILGDCQDARDRISAAFASYTSCNAALHSAYAPKFRKPDSVTIPAYLSWLTRYFQRTESFARPPPDAVPEAPVAEHIFIVGFPRSGTTLLEEALLGHPDIRSTGERDGLEHGVREFLADPAGLERLSYADPAAFQSSRDAYWQRLQDLGVDYEGKILLDKQPYNTIKLPLIARLFPTAKIVFALRDPRDIVLSCFRRRFRMNSSNFELLTLRGAAHFYDATMRLAEIYAAKLPLPVHRLRHEDLVADFEAQMHALCAFSGIAGDASFRDFATRQGFVATPSAPQLIGGLNARGVGQWRRYREQLEPVLPLLAPWVEHFGYKS